MKPLSKEASDALSALKSPEPSAADEARVRKNLERALGMAIPVAGVAVGATAASAQAATGAGMSGAAGGATALSLGAKVAGLVLAVGVGTTVTVLAVRTERAEAPVIVATKQPPPEPVAVVAPVEDPEVEEVSVVEEKPPIIEEPSREAASPVKLAVRARPVVQEPVRAEAPPAAVAEPTPAEPEPAAQTNTEETYDLQIETQFPTCDAATELRSALYAQRVLKQSRAEESLGLLEAYQRRCPSGRWSDEAWAARLGALCVLGRHTEVRGFLEWFTTESPERRASIVSDLQPWCSVEILKQ